MPKVMPVAIRDETGAFIRQMAQGNEAMARMYMQLLARYQERLAAQEFRSGESATNRQHAFDILERREQLYRERKQGDAPVVDNPLSRGAAAHPRQPAAPTTAPTTAAPTQAPQPQVPPAYNPKYPPLQGGATIPGAREFKPQGSSTQKFSMSQEAMDAYAEAPRSADHTDFSAQSIVKGAAEPKPEKGTPSTVRPAAAAPRDPARLPNMPKKVKLAEFQPIRREWIDMMNAEERKNGLPQGTLLTLYGMENGGGRVFGNDPTKAYGMFQFTKALRDRYKVSDADAMNPSVMIPLAAANLKYNGDKFAKLTGKPLPDTAEYMPYWTALHQWGEGDGPRLVAAALQGSGHMQAREVMLKNIKMPDGRMRDPAAVLVANKLGSNITVAEAIKDQSTRGQPYHTTALKVMGDPDTYAQDDDVVSDPNAPRPPANIPPQQGSMGANPRLINAIRGGAQLALPNGYTIRQVSGHRPGDSGYHGRREAGDFKIFKPDGTAIPHKGDDTTGMYTRLARGVKTWLGENDPQFRVNWGGAHSTQKRGGTVPDLMHFDTGPDRGRLRPDLRMSQLRPLSAEERNAPATAVAAKPAPQKVAAAPTATRTDVVAAAPAAEPYQATPIEGQKPEQAAVTAAMFGVGKQEPISTMGPRGFGAQTNLPLTRTSQLGPIRDAATVSGFEPPAKLGPIMPAASGSEYDSAMSAPHAPMQPAATGSEYDSSLSAPYAPMQPAAEGNEYDAGPPLNLSGNMPSISWQGSPYQQATRQTQEAKLPSWEYPDQPPAPDVAQGAPLPSGDISANAYSPAIAEAQRMMAGQEYPFPVTDAPAANVGDMGASGMPGTQVAPPMPGGGADTTSAAVPPTTTATDAPYDVPPMPEVYSGVPDLPRATAPSAPSAPMGEYNVFNSAARKRRAQLASQGASELWQGGKNAISDAIFNTNAERKPLPTQGVAIEPIKRVIEELRTGNKLKQAQQSGTRFDTEHMVVEAMRDWWSRRNATDTPKSVKTIDPTKPDPSSTKPNAAATSSKQHPTARVEQDEPLVLRPKPGSAYVPFQGITPGGPAGTTAPPMARKPGTMGATAAPQGGVVFQRVGPGQFIAVPADQAQQQQEQPVDQELVVE